MDTFDLFFDPRYQLEAEEPLSASALPERQLIHEEILLTLQRLDGLSDQLRQRTPG
ncbi:hypothetical protein [Aquipseudomonas ullengensis]|uniref:Uncharacterized protein n=1 Tax=Aquipseudomonas ullengensis TaxID=2759166 RepID=A0A7W4LPG1_9GAMM|nr:hypothetical protein [Pseudomonas ullengensis]MBB2496760.1 hypothetical protein [Pseudomonas ullengensis]